MANSAKFIQIAKITSAHSIKGEVKLFLYSEDISAYPRFYLKDQETEMSFRGFKGKTAIAKIKNIETRNQAETLKNEFIYINREDMPEPTEGSFYFEDLIGLTVKNNKDKEAGKIVNVENFGAGDIITIEFNNGQTEQFPFSDATFPEIDLKEGVVKFEEPEIV